jgi:hypothetical protein
VEFGLTELEQSPALLELAATATPFRRPTFWPYILGETDATSIEDYLDRYQVGGQPVTSKRLYAGLVSSEPNRGVSGSMNQFRPHVEAKSLSIMEFAVYCPAEGDAQEMVGVVISVDKANGFGPDGKALEDGEPRLHIEYARPKGGHVEYEWDGLDGQFVVNPLRRYHPGQIVPVSEVGGTQVEHLIAIFQSPTGDWWIAYKDDLLGYYPASLFTTLNGGACASAWYGEVYDPAPLPSPAPDAIDTEMGSGKFAETGFLHAAYVRNPKYYDLYWYGEPPKDDAAMAPYAPLCYDRSPFSEGIFFLGGPGGKNPACIWP